MTNNNESLEKPQPNPSIAVPESSSTVTVRLIDTSAYGRVPASLVFTPTIPGLSEFYFPSYAFLISNNDRHILFDAGMRKDWETALPPGTADFIKDYMPFEIKRDVVDILDEDTDSVGVTSKSITDIIWSHHHFDHRGDPGRFLPSTNIVWGPGSTKAYIPAYPTDSASSIHESELEGRYVREITEDEFTLTIGDFPAHDFFGDGSFHLLSSPGHTIGHLSGLARVTSETPTTKATYIFMGGDCAHYPAVFRPSDHLPLPSTIPAAAGTKYGIAPCAGAALIDKCHYDAQNHKHARHTPFLKANQGVNVDQSQAEKSISGMQALDADPNVLVVIAHDASLLGQVDFYPKTLNSWQERGWKREELIWRFCGDFER